MKTRVCDNKQQVYDPVRRKWVVLNPEEHVRQTLLEYLFTELKVPVSLTGVEFSLSNIEPGNRKLVDILVWIPGGKPRIKPWLLVECKAPSIKISEKTKDQVMGYMKSIKSQYLMLTSGTDSRYFKFENGAYKKIENLPVYPGESA